VLTDMHACMSTGYIFVSKVYINFQLDLLYSGLPGYFQREFIFGYFEKTFI